MCRVDICISREPQLRHTQADAYTRTSRSLFLVKSGPVEGGQLWAKI